MSHSTMEVEVAGQELIFETGKIARQANGSVVLRVEDTVVFSTACASSQGGENIDFLPLRVDYQEKFSSTGKTISGFIKREGRPSEREILLSRLIDRSLRPLFPDGYYNEIQVLSYVWSYDGKNLPAPLAICAASAALLISDIPFEKPLAGVRVGMVDGEFVVNPSAEQQENSKLNLLMAGTQDAILMIEGHCDFLTEEQVLDALEIGHSAIKTICEKMEEWRQAIGKEKIKDTIKELPSEIVDSVDREARSLLVEALQVKEKLAREKALKAVKEKVFEALVPADTDSDSIYNAVDVGIALKKVSSKIMREMVLNTGTRCDGRQVTDIRPITIENDILPRTHGSALFTRGETQTMAVCTLGGESSAQRYETLETEGARRFYLQYFFPPFSVGEVGRMGPPGRREVGHGKLAERSLKYTLPDQKTFPYTIRLESNITESNGSSSMASVCGGCLAMMDAGVPITRAVSGIAMGLILYSNEKYIILSDILGVEDALGDMDFKITGDKEGITSFQMDIKVEGITRDIMAAALAQAKQGRIHILEKMLEACSEPKAISSYAPRIETIQVKPSKIATIIGPGGKQIRAIIDQTGVEIDINDDGLVNIVASDAKSMEAAREIILSLIEEVEVGKVYNGKVASIMPFGVFVEVLPGKDGLCHISELMTTRVENIEDHFKVGDEITVKVMEINDRGQLKLSRRVTLPGGDVERKKHSGNREHSGNRDNNRRSGGGGHHKGSNHHKPREKSNVPPPPAVPSANRGIIKPPEIIKKEDV